MTPNDSKGIEAVKQKLNAALSRTENDGDGWVSIPYQEFDGLVSVIQRLPEGVVCVPREPVDERIEAAAKAVWSVYGHGLDRVVFRTALRAYLAPLPAFPEEKE